MKYSVTYDCGHEGYVQLFGKTTDRERKLSYLSTCICPDCKKAQQDKANAAAANKAAEAGLPELTGTPKQIAWAESIRYKYYEFILDYISKCPDSEDKESAITTVTNALKLESATKSSWWIDNRDKDKITLANILHKMLLATQQVV